MRVDVARRIICFTARILSLELASSQGGRKKVLLCARNTHDMPRTGVAGSIYRVALNNNG